MTHGFDRGRHDAALGALARRYAAGDVHLRQHPAAENVAMRIGVGRHGKRARGQLAARRRGVVGH